MRVRLLFRAIVLAMLGLLVLPALVLAATPSPVLVLNGAQFWTLLIGAISPLVGYVLNHYAPWVSEPVKAAVQVVLTAVASTIYTAVGTKTFGANAATFELIVSGVISALVVHKILWLPSGLSVLLGGGSNAPKPAAKVARHPAAHRG